FDFSCPPASVPSAPAAGVGGCLSPTLAVSKATYARGEPIVATFANGPGAARDWIGIYPRGVAPHPPSTLWGYVGGGGHMATVGPSNGTITVAAGSEVRTGDWPLAVGAWTAYLLSNDTYEDLASADFEVR